MPSPPFGRWPARLLAATFALLAVHCSFVANADLGSGVGSACTKNGDCQGGLCEAGVCTLTCSAPSDCPAPSLCIEQRCRLGCQADGECAPDQICQANACVAGCRNDTGERGCATGQICEQNACKEGCRADDICGAGKICLDAVCAPGCRGDAGCSTGQICEALACKAGCRADDVCGAGKICVDTVCQEGCKQDEACGAGKICEQNACKEGCRTDEACGAGKICEAQACKEGCRNDQGCGAGLICEAQACKAGCRADDPAKGCPTGEICRESVCKPAVRVSALLPGLVDGSDGWSQSHKLGLDEAAAKLPAVQFGADEYHLKEQVRKADEFNAAFASEAKAGANVIVTASRVGNERVLEEAAKYPGVRFLAAGSRNNGALPNVGAYSARTEQLWFASGRLAARVADRGKKCIGLILPTPTKDIIRETNAFALGARFQEPSVKVVIRWLGGSRDFGQSPSYSYKATGYDFDSAANGKLYREELLAAQLADLGCTLLAHRTETQRLVAAVQTRFQVPVNQANQAQFPGNHNLFSLGVDARDACKINNEWQPSCLGSPYWNWGPLYAKLLDQIDRNTWTPGVTRENFSVGPDALLKLEQSPFPNVTGIAKDDAKKYLEEIADLGPEAVFTGPFSFNGQRDLDKNNLPDPNQKVLDGLTVEDDELDRMCWFVDGVYELPDPTVVDSTTLIPAVVPYGPPVAGQITTTTDAAADKKKYGDVTQFIKGQGLDPTKIMSCSLN